MKFDAIFFDMDGLLVDTEGLYLKATNDILKPLGLEITLDWYIKENLQEGKSNIEVASALARKKGIPENVISQLRPRRNDRYGELLKEHVPVVDGAFETLRILQNKFMMEIVTSARRDHFEIIMKKTGFQDFFAFFLTADDVVDVKPDPELYLKALERSGQKADTCLVLEDSRRGVQAAKEAGLTCWAIPDALTRTHDFSNADKVLSSIREIPSLLGI